MNITDREDLTGVEMNKDKDTQVWTSDENAEGENIAFSVDAEGIEVQSARELHLSHEEGLALAAHLIEHCGKAIIPSAEQVDKSLAVLARVETEVGDRANPEEQKLHAELFELFGELRCLHQELK